MLRHDDGDDTQHIITAGDIQQYLIKRIVARNTKAIAEVNQEVAIECTLLSSVPT